MNIETLAARRIEVEDWRNAHLEHDINPDMAFRSLLPWMQEFPQAGSDQWCTAWPRQGARLETSLAGFQHWSSVTFDEGSSRALPAWLRTRLDRQWKETELFGEYRSGRVCRSCNESIWRWWINRHAPARTYGLMVFPDVFRALSRRHRRVLARDVRRSVSPDVRALVVQMRVLTALGGDVLAMAA